MSEAQKKSAAEIVKMHRQLMLTIKVLTADVRFAEAQWRLDKSQFWHRTVIRCVCALVEGTLGLFKNISIPTAGFYGISLSEDDLKVATERRKCRENNVEKMRPAFLPFPDNVKQTFKLLTKAHGVEVKIKYDADGFSELCKTFELRNKLMHPKGPFDLQVTDDALHGAVKGMTWFDGAVALALDECKKKIPSTAT